MTTPRSTATTTPDCPREKINDVIRAQLDKKPHDVANMFDRVARRYDITNTMLSVGQDRMWRSEMHAALELTPGDTVLDLAAGTGVSTTLMAESGAHAVACDFSLGMMRQGRQDRPLLQFVAGDGMRLPFSDETFDAVTISFGLRNIVDFSTGLAEMLRVTKPGGRLVVCEFSTPTWAPWRTVYNEYLMKALPEIAKRASSNPSAYVYLAESIRAWPNQEQLAKHIQEVGWRKVRYKNLSGGIVALHHATRPRINPNSQDR